MHDYLRVMYVAKEKMDVDVCDELFFRAQWQFGMPKWRARARTWGVRYIGWIFWSKWKWMYKRWKAKDNG